MDEIADRPLLRINVVRLAFGVLSLPTFGFITCVLLSIIYNFEGSTATHCKVPNYLPSASSAIGGFTPQRYIWRICIGLHCFPRFFFTLLYYNHYLLPRVSSSTEVFYKTLVTVNAILNVVENICLIMLTFISSTENYSVHEKSFIGFMIFSELHMILTIILFRWSSSLQPSRQKSQISFWCKFAFCLTNLLSFASAIYFFFRHNKHCEPGIYTWFAFCEYLTILSNIAFHGTAAIDFEDKYLFVMTGSNGLITKTKSS